MPLPSAVWGQPSSSGQFAASCSDKLNSFTHESAGDIGVLTMPRNGCTERAMNALHPLAPTPSILVVDADDDTRALYRQSFALAGCEVVEASDGREALTRALMRPPTVVVTEITLPLVDGYGLCEILRRDRATADIPILVVTADARPAQTDRARRAGADSVLVKPTPIEHILNEVRRLVADATDVRRHAAATRTHAAARHDVSATPVASSEPHRRMSLAKSFSRFTTTTPPASPPALVCPSCDSPLTYEQSHVGGVSERHAEQWDHYVCPESCGVFQYRQRTRTLRRLS
jgi:CheY-like chemotaxis protein